MRNNILVELEQVVDQLPDRRFSYTFTPSGVQVTLKYNNLWHGEIRDINKFEECRAATFEEIDNNLLRNYLHDQSLQQLLEAAKKQLANKA